MTANVYVDTSSFNFENATISGGQVGITNDDYTYVNADIRCDGSTLNISMKIPYLHVGESTSYEINGAEINMQSIPGWRNVSNQMLEVVRDATRKANL